MASTVLAASSQSALLPRVVFLVLSGVALVSAVLVVLPRTSPVHSALYLVLAFFAVGGHYVLLNAQFLAAVHVLVYAGAIMVLFLFVIMLLNQREVTSAVRSRRVWVSTGVGALLFSALLVALHRGEHGAGNAFGPDSGIGLVGRVAGTLFGEYRAPFELASLLFLAAIVGAVLLSRRDKPESPRSERASR
jgi:NADH-quinone oxidoreductase subunit J